jgi:predicted O-linked N-acetylglucosamine transferase (SPINDLY family)
MTYLQTSLDSAHFQQATALMRQQEFQQAASLYEQCVEADPTISVYYWQLGVAQLLQGNEAEAQFTWSMVLAEADAEQAESLTAELLEVLRAEIEQQAALGQLENVLCLWQYRQEIAPEIDPMINLFLKIFEQRYEDPQLLGWAEACLPYIHENEAFINVVFPKIVTLYLVLGRVSLACRYGELCLQLDRNHAETLIHLSRIYQKEGRYAEAIELAKQYCANCQNLLQKTFGSSVWLRGLMSTGAQWAEAEVILRQQTALLESCITTYQATPDEFLDAALLCAPLFFYPYFKDDPQTTRSLQNRMAAMIQDSLQSFVIANRQGYQPYPVAPARSRPHKKLRIGYIAQFMKRHSVGWLSRWVFEHFDRERFEVYAYFNQHIRIESFTDQWFASQATRACCFNGDALGIAQAIREDEIDILIDLDSITSDATCNVMALKPAPIQVSWLGMDASGLPAIDYFIADPYVLPDSAQNIYAEQIWRLPHTYIAVDGFEVGIPTLRREQFNIPEDAVTYFSSQYAYKRHPQTIRLQMQIILQVPNSFFLIKGGGDQQQIQELFCQIAEECGLAADRLRFLPQDKNEETHRANLAIADIVLDTFPYNGATTTMETLWMGIPLVTRVGEQFAARNSYTMMMNAGITEGIAWTDEEYVQWGVCLGKDAALRQQVRGKLWQSRQTSPLWNAKQFTRDLENAYEQMWQRYVQS